VLLAILGTACPALATDWRLLAAHDDQSVTLYYDRHSVRVSGDLIKVRIKRVYASDEGLDVAAAQGLPEVVAYTVELVALDCGRNRLAPQRTTWFGERGKVLDRTIFSGYPWRDMRPQGFGRALCEELD
jgi:hypothetical protein